MKSNLKPKKEKRDILNDNNMHLTPFNNPDTYFPSQLPFFNPADKVAAEKSPGSELAKAALEDNDPLKRKQSHMSGVDLEKEFCSGVNDEPDRELCEMIYDEMTG